MKDYEHVIVWLDYFNRTLSRAKGRRLPRDRCVPDPSLKELTEAAQAAGLAAESPNETARYPRRAYVRSGYIAVPKGSSKTSILNKISEKMAAKRQKRSGKSSS